MSAPAQDGPEQLTLHDALGTEPANQLMDWAGAAQRAAERHLLECELALWCESGECEQPGHDGVDLSCPSPASAPYDGCHTCQIRETLHAALPLLRRGVRHGQL